MNIVITVDVEEDGLSTGRYEPHPATFANLEHLAALLPVSQNYNIPLTLFLTYAAARADTAARTIDHIRANAPCELAAHLHHWSTPPLASLSDPHRIPCAQLLSPDLFHDKIIRLNDAIQARFGARPVSFRMGRFDIELETLPRLARHQFKVDSSIVPWRTVHGGPRSHFLIPPEPFRVPAEPSLLEVPLTIESFAPALTAAAGRMASRLPACGRGILYSWIRACSCAGIWPAVYSLPAMKQVIRLARQRRRTLVNVFLHSVDLRPRIDGRPPRSLTRLDALLAWMVRTGTITGMTLSDVATRWPAPDRA